MEGPSGASRLHQVLDESMEDERNQLIPMLMEHLQFDVESATYYLDTLFEELDGVLNCGDPYMAFYCTSAEIRKVTKETQFGNFSCTRQFGIELSIDLELVIQDFKDIIGGGGVGLPNFLVEKDSEENQEAAANPAPEEETEVSIPNAIVNNVAKEVIPEACSEQAPAMPIDIAVVLEPNLEHNITPDGDDSDGYNAEKIRYGFSEVLLKDAHMKQDQVPGCFPSFGSITKRLMSPFDKRRRKPGSTEQGVMLHHVNGKQFMKTNPI